MTTGELKHTQALRDSRFKNGVFSAQDSGFSLSGQNGGTLSALCFRTDALEPDRVGTLDLRLVYRFKKTVFAVPVRRVICQECGRSAHEPLPFAAARVC